MGDNKHRTLIAVTKADTIWLVIVILAFSLGCVYARFSEKIAALEDVVFVHGLYQGVEKGGE